jgi:hypothetical protein
MSTINVVHMQQSGPIPGIVGWYSGGQTYYIDTDQKVVINQEPMQQQAYDASPLVETVPIEQSAQEEVPEMSEESEQPEMPLQEAAEPQEDQVAPPETPVQILPPQPDRSTPVQEEAMPEVVGVPDLQETPINEGEIS